MTGFLAEAGKQLAGRWAALLALPAVLLIAAVAVAATLGLAEPARPTWGVRYTVLLSERLRKGC